MASSKTHLDLKNFFDTLRKNLGVTIQSSQMRKMAGLARDLIRNRTRAGFGVSGTGDNLKRVKLKPLEDSTITTRGYFKHLSSETSPSTSNLTMAGRLLDSMRITSQRNGGATLGFTGKNRKLSNEDVAEFVQDTRPFFALTNNEKGSLTKSFKANFYKNIGRGLT